MVAGCFGRGCSSMVFGRNRSEYILQGDLSAMEISILLLYRDGGNIIQRSHSLFHRRAANADLFYAPVGYGYGSSQFHYRNENSGVSDNSGAVFVGYGCVDASFLSDQCEQFLFLTVVGLLCNSTFIILIILFCVSKRATDKILRKGIWIFHKLHLCKHPEERYEKIKQELAVFHESSNLFGKTWKPYLTTCILTIVQIACTCSIPYFIYRSFGFLEQPINVIMAAQAYVSMVSAFVPLPGASGGAEGSFVLFFRSFFSEGTIIPAMVVWRTMSYYLNFPIGCICTYIADRLPKLSFGSEKMKECA
jgi:hypothetical protein